MATKKAAEKTTSTPAVKATSTPVPKADSAPVVEAPVVKMTKAGLVKAMSEKTDIEPKHVQAFFDSLLEIATEQTRETGEFTMPGFGKFVKAERKERMGRNPATGEEIRIAAKTTVKFRIAKGVTEAIAPSKP